MHRSNIDEKIAAMMAHLESGQSRPSAGAHKASCKVKDRYATEEAARAFALMNGTQAKLLTYRCTHCNEWHLARRHKGS